MNNAAGSLPLLRYMLTFQRLTYFPDQSVKITQASSGYFEPLRYYKNTLIFNNLLNFDWSTRCYHRFLPWRSI